MMEDEAEIVPESEVDARLVALRDELKAVAEKHGPHMFVCSFGFSTPKEVVAKVLVAGCGECALNTVKGIKEAASTVAPPPARRRH